MRISAKMLFLVFFLAFSGLCNTAHAWLRWNLGFSWGIGSPVAYYPRYFFSPTLFTGRLYPYPKDNTVLYRPSVLFPITGRRAYVGPAYALGENKKMQWLESKNSIVAPADQMPTETKPETQIPLNKEEVPLLRVQPEAVY